MNTTLSRRSLPQEAVDFMLAHGFRVYMRNRADSYAIFEGAGGIGYVEFDPVAGYSVSTVHAPNRESGTGYQIARHVSALTVPLLERAIRTIVPHEWREHKAPRKYASMADYKARDSFRAGYEEIKP